MALFKKKSKPVIPVYANNFDYLHTEEELNFLNSTISRKMERVNNFEIIPFAQQLVKKSDYITDSDLDGILTDIVSEIMNDMSEHYKEFIIFKYFGDEAALIRYISEVAYGAIIVFATSANNDKIKKIYSEELAATLAKMNNKEK